ncbi:hypothetical protein BJ165DRAFT_1611938 [Panaeolus papilionaceus]|nr:hypothetical protein BJ165DRAFT_1611938 [Panaeolus papilionaceus]
MSCPYQQQVMSSKENHITFPIEIFQLIIDAINEDTKCSASERLRDLRACSLVCWSFVALCQRHIFAKAQVGPGSNGGLERNRLAVSLQSNASLANFVKRMVFSLPVFSSPRDLQPENAPFLSLLLHLPRVQHLQISSADLSPDFGRVIGQPYGASHFFKQYISSGSLTSLSIQGVKFVPLHDILSAVNLTKLKLRLCGLASESGLPPVSSSLRLVDFLHVDGVSLSCFPAGMNLDTLCLLRSFKGFVRNLSFSTVFPTLKKLRIHACVNTRTGPNEDTIVSNYILKSVTQLECLVIEAVNIGTSPQIPLRIRECISNTRASLKRLHLYYTTGTMDIITDGIYDVLSSVPTHNIIKEIEIILLFRWSIRRSSTTLGSIMMPTLELWSKLDELLDEDILRFPCLRKVHIKILVLELKYDHTLHGINHGELNEFRRDFGRSFRRLRTNPKIVFRGQPVVCISYQQANIRYRY